MEVDVHFRRPALGNLVGGQSGPSVRCVSMRRVAEILLAMRSGELKEVPVVGVGGISSGEDAARFLLLGASAVQVGSAVLDGDLAAFSVINEQLRDYMGEMRFKKLDDFRGMALEWLATEGGGVMSSYGLTPQPATIIRNELLVPDTARLIIRPRYPENFHDIMPGQYVMLWVPHAAGRPSDGSDSDMLPFSITGRKVMT